LGHDCYIIAEKILESKEGLPSAWPIEGTSGYEFLSFVSQLVTSRKGARQLVSFYKTLIPGQLSYKELVARNKWLILENYMTGEWDNLVSLMASSRLTNGFTKARMKMALGWLMVSLPVYRIYPEAFPVVGEDRTVMNEAFQKALSIGGDYQKELMFLQTVLLDGVEDGDPSDVLQFLKRLMQFTGPLTAKGVEDTTFYVYNALISHDEVGDAPSSLGISIAEFHRKMVNRQLTTPLSLNTTATHDTKRGEDSRIRLNVLCDYPELWQKHVEGWIAAHNKIKSRTSKGIVAPTVNDEYYIYQSIVGGFPENAEISEAFVSRLIEYHTKVLREAKVNTNWSEPDEEYEQACQTFIRRILVPDSFFVNGVTSLLKTISVLAWRYSVAQSLIKITAPGIPDTYQGGGLWDLSFVDPDNRRPVNYSKRVAFLEQIKEKSQTGSPELFSYLDDHRHEGIEKLFVTWKALNFRKDNPEMFTKGSYLPLQVSGGELVTVAFARHHENKWLLVVIPLRINERKDQVDLTTDDVILLPEGAPSLWRNVFTDETMETNGKLALGNCFNRFAIAMLINY
jgi:(1->4)-alpha-D-glucan 1-alpha-D-glucosylmutase